MSTFSSKLIVPQTAAVDAGAPGSLYGAPTSLTVPETTPTPLPAGDWFVIANADVAVTIPDASGTVHTVLAAGHGGLIRSDGFNTNAVASAATTLIIFPPT